MKTANHIIKKSSICESFSKNKKNISPHCNCTKHAFFIVTTEIKVLG